MCRFLGHRWHSVSGNSLCARRCRRSANAGNRGVICTDGAAISAYGDLRLAEWFLAGTRVVQLAARDAGFNLSPVRFTAILDAFRVILAGCLHWWRSLATSTRTRPLPVVEGRVLSSGLNPLDIPKFIMRISFVRAVASILVSHLVRRFR
jgi:hypothetical protein